MVVNVAVWVKVITSVVTVEEGLPAVSSHGTVLITVDNTVLVIIAVIVESSSGEILVVSHGTVLVMVSIFVDVITVVVSVEEG